LQVNISPDIEDAWSSLSASKTRIETRRFGAFTLRLGVGGAALAPLYQPAKKKMRRFEPFLIRRGITQQANISWIESE